MSISWTPCMSLKKIKKSYNNILTMAFWQWNFNNDNLTMKLWEWNFDNDLQNWIAHTEKKVSVGWTVNWRNPAVSESDSNQVDPYFFWLQIIFLRMNCSKINAIDKQCPT